MTGSVFEGETKSGKRIRIVPFTPDHSQVIVQMKEGFTKKQQEEIDTTINWYKGRYFENKEIQNLVSGKEYNLLENGKRIAFMGVYNIGWSPEDVAWCFVEPTVPNPDGRKIKGALEKLLGGKRVALIEAPESTGRVVMEEIGLQYAGRIPNNIDVFSIAPKRNCSSGVDLETVTGGEGKVFKSSSDVDVAYYVALDEKENALGFTGIYNFNHHKEKTTSWLGWTGVPQNHQGEGIGRILVEAMIKQAEQNGSEHFCIETYGGAKYKKQFESANILYPKLSFDRVVEIKNFFEGNPLKGEGMNLRIYSREI